MNRKISLLSLAALLLVVGGAFFAQTSTAGTKKHPVSLSDAMSGEHQGIGARDLKANGTPRRANPAPSAPTADPDGAVVAINGCITGYGTAGECLPATPGSASEMGMTREEMPWQCQEVLLTFPKGLAVAKGKDVLHLDTNGDGTACGSGDAMGVAGSHGS